MASKRTRAPVRRKSARKKPAAAKFVPAAHQTVGPFFPVQFIRPSDNDLTGGVSDGRPRALGQAILLFGRVSDINDSPAVNVLLEIWQPNAAGRFNHPLDKNRAPIDPNFSGWGRTATERDGSYRFTTIKPGGYPAGPRSNRWFAPRLSMTIVGSGLMRPLVTCVYFPDEPLNDEDPQLAAIRDARARRQLIALPDHHPGAPDGVPAYRFDIRLGGKQATPFLED